MDMRGGDVVKDADGGKQQFSDVSEGMQLLQRIRVYSFIIDVSIDSFNSFDWCSWRPAMERSTADGPWPSFHYYAITPVELLKNCKMHLILLSCNLLKALSDLP